MAIAPAEGIVSFEDLQLGSAGPFGAYPVTRESIVEFARRFDPQPIHLDDDAAKRSVVGGLCASGFHTCAMMMRLLCDHFLLRTDSLGSPGVDEVKFVKPVRPGDVLSVRMRLTEKRVLQSRPDIGIAKMVFELLDATATPVLWASSNQLLRLRHPAAAAPSPEKSASAKSGKSLPPSLFDRPALPAYRLDGNYFEDQRVGDVYELGEHTFERDEMLAFARAFDPQLFHLDEAAAARSLFGGLSASGWLTASMFIRGVVLARQKQEAALAAAGRPVATWGPSPGFRNLGWPKPVLVGDTIAYRIETVECRELRSRPDRGLVISNAEGRNQRGETAFRFTAQMFVDKRRN